MFYLRELHFSLLAMGKDRGKTDEGNRKDQLFSPMQRIWRKVNFTYICVCVWGGGLWGSGMGGEETSNKWHRAGRESYIFIFPI